MEFSRVDLSNVIAISHDDGQLGLVIDRGDSLDIIEIPAPYAAYQGLQQLNYLISSDDSTEAIDLTALSASKPALPEESMQPVQSSMANAIGYDAKRNLLQMEFANGAIYQYQDVEPETYQALQKTDSIGQFFNREIKGNYPCDRC